MPAQQIPRTMDAYQSDVAQAARQAKHLPNVGFRGFGYAFKRSVIEGWFEQGMDRASTLTYYTVLTFAPALLAIYSIATLVMAGYSDAIVSLTDDVIHRYVPSEYAATVTDIVSTIIGSASGGIVALTIGIIFALISSSAYVRAFSRSANQIYQISEGRQLISYHARMLGITLVMLVGSFIVLLSLALTRGLVDSLLAPFATTLKIQGFVDFMVGVFFPVWDWLAIPFIIVVVMTLLAVLYNYAPNVQQRKFRWLSTGSAVTIAGFVIVAKLLQLYLINFAAMNPYGAMGAIIAVFTGLWAMNTMLLFGFKLDAEVERVRQIKAGFAAEEHIQLPPKDMRAAEAEQRSQFALIEKARQFRPVEDED